MSQIPVAEDHVRQQIQRLSESELFRASEIQRRLLKYLAERSLSGEAEQLKEYTIGVEGIGKPPSYDPRRDSTVRLQTSKLRQKMTEYYLTVGQRDPVLIDFPKGHFKFVFSKRGPDAAPAAEQMRINWRTLAAVLTGALLLSAALCVWLAVRLGGLKKAAVGDPLPPSVEQFWGPLAASSKPTLVCLGTPMFVRLGPAGFFRDSDVNSWDAVLASGLNRKLERAFPGAQPEPWYVFTTLGEAGGAFTLGRVLSSRMPNLQLANSTELSWAQIRSDNVVFIGPNRFNLQISALPVHQDFAIETAGIRNLNRRAGEPAFYEDVSDGHASGLAHALISRLPGLHGDGHIVVLAGSGIPGTMAATEFVTNEHYAAEMLQRIRLSSGQLPRYYQVVIKCRYNQWIPVEVSYVVHHVVMPVEGGPGSTRATAPAHAN